MAVWLPEQQLNTQSFLPAEWQSTRRGRIAWVALVDYQTSDVGPYYELLYIGGSLQFGQQRHLSISKIYVSSMDSVVNGQQNWGIPKEMAHFDFRQTTTGNDQMHISREDGQRIASFEFSHHLAPFKVSTLWLPKKLRTLGQYWQKQLFTFDPQATGYIKPARLRYSWFDSRYFPDLSQGKMMACFKVTRFDMVFPVANIQNGMR